MHLLVAWRDSLTLFIPKNLKLFLLVTINAIPKTYKALLNGWKVFFGLLLLGWFSILSKIPYPEFGGSLYSSKIDLIDVVPWCMALWFVMVCCAAARSSVMPKDNTYFSRFKTLSVSIFSGSFLPLWTLVFFSLVYRNMLFRYLFTITDNEQVRYYYYIIKQIVPVPYASPLMIFILLFSFDSDGSLSELWLSIKRAFTMLVYNLPLIILMNILVMLLTIVVFRIAYYVPVTFEWVFAIDLIVMVPIAVTLWSNVYIKKLHDDPQLYFEQPK